MSKTKTQNTDLNAAAPKAAALKPGTKKARLADLLKPRKGVTITQLSSTLGWQAHSTRAAITGLRKAGIEVERLAAREPGEVSRYRLVSKAGR